MMWLDKIGHVDRVQHRLDIEGAIESVHINGVSVFGENVGAFFLRGKANCPRQWGVWLKSGSP